MLSEKFGVNRHLFLDVMEGFMNGEKVQGGNHRIWTDYIK